jgi:hypothetical protein
VGDAARVATAEEAVEITRRAPPDGRRVGGGAREASVKVDDGAGVGGGDEGGDPLPQVLVEAARGRPPAAAMQQAPRPVAGEALLEAVELSNREAQGRGALLVGDPAGEGGVHQARPGHFLPAHREGLRAPG